MKASLLPLLPLLLAAAGGRIEFVTEKIENIPAGWRAKESPRTGKAVRGGCAVD